MKRALKTTRQYIHQMEKNALLLADSLIPDECPYLPQLEAIAVYAAQQNWTALELSRQLSGRLLTKDEGLADLLGHHIELNEAQQ